MSKVFMFPGQGSQKIGMSEGIFENYPEYVARANEILNYDLIELCMNQEGKLNQTEFTQPALYVVNAFMGMIQKEKPIAVLGHSLGEYNALLYAKCFDFETGLKLVQKRGQLMSQIKGGAMAAILGFNSQQVNDILVKWGNDNIEVSNFNSPTQIVISGIKEDIINVQNAFVKAGVRRFVILPTSGAFHSKYMKKSQEEFAEFIAQFSFNKPALKVIANVNAEPYPADIKNNLIQQISSPVKWGESIQNILVKNFEVEFIECGPGKILSGLIRQIEKLNSNYLS